MAHQKLRNPVGPYQAPQTVADPKSARQILYLQIRFYRFARLNQFAPQYGR
jgi:hypothetical protein